MAPRRFDPNEWDDKNPAEKAAILGGTGFLFGSFAVAAFNAWHGLPTPSPSQKFWPYARKVFTRPLVIGGCAGVATATSSFVADMTNLILNDGRPTFWGSFVGPFIGMNFLGLMSA